MSPPAISVVMSVFNGEKFLPEAMDSILRQSFRDFEFIVVDDGSTDATGKILSKYEFGDNRIRVLRDGNKGRSAALNLGMNLAGGKYVAILDADDVAAPRRLEEQIAFMERNPEVGVLGGAFELMSDSGRGIGIIRHPVEDAEIRSVILRYNPICHSSAMVRKELALALGGYRRAFEPSEDYDLWLRMSERGRLANLPNVLVQYRIHGDQLSVRKLERQTLCVLAASAAAEERRHDRADPFNDSREVSKQALKSMGVSPERIHTAFVQAYGGWISQVKDINPDATLELIEQLIQLSRSGPVEPRILAKAWLAAARIHYKQKKPASALRSAGRAILSMPKVAADAMRVRIWHPLLNLTRPMRHALGLRKKSVEATDNVYKEWAEREFAAPAPHFVKHKVLLRNGLLDATWVESGTYMGDTTSVLSKVAKMIYSIEPEPTLFSKAKQRFSNTNNVRIIMGLSEDVFPTLLATLNGDVCFWLDGHYSAGITFKGPQETPIMDELSVIGQNITQMAKVVVMIDDVRCFDRQNLEYSAYPSVDVLVDWARTHNLSWHIEHDIFIAKKI